MRRRLVVIVLVSVLLIALAATTWAVTASPGYCPVTGIEPPGFTESSSNGS